MFFDGESSSYTYETNVIILANIFTGVRLRSALILILLFGLIFIQSGTKRRPRWLFEDNEDEEEEQELIRLEKVVATVIVAAILPASSKQFSVLGRQTNVIRDRMAVVTKILALRLSSKFKRTYTYRLGEEDFDRLYCTVPGVHLMHVQPNYVFLNLINFFAFSQLLCLVTIPLPSFLCLFVLPVCMSTVSLDT